MGDTGRISAYLGVLPDRTELRYINVGTSRRVSQLVFCSLKTQLDDTDAWRVQTRRTCTVYVRVPDLRPARTTPIELRLFGEKSGTVVYTVGEANGGVFAVNMADGTVQKLADGGGYNTCRNI
jgi:hypothetical protein